MQQDSFVLQLPRECVGKSSSWHTLYEQSHESLDWRTPDPRVSPMHLMSSSLILDPIYRLREQFPELMWTAESLLVPTESPSDVYALYEAFEHCEIPLDVQQVSVYEGELRPKLKPEVQQVLSQIVSYAKVAITVTTNFILHFYGNKQSVAYARYKLFVVLNHFYGYSILKMELPLSKQPLVAGPDRQHLLTVFQQTGINVYMPPLLSTNDDVSVNEIYLAGDKVQLVVAEKLLSDVIIRKTDTLEKECVISSFVRDTLLMHCQSGIEQIMVKYATFIQLPPTGGNENTVRVMGTTRRSIDYTIDSLMRLCGSVYCLELKAHLDQSLAVQIAATGVSLMNTASGTVIYGLNNNIKQTLKALKSAGSDGIAISVLLEQPVELMDFILGKKQGKILKVIHGTGTTITVEKFHEYNFRLRLKGERASLILDALKLLEEELPAEKSLYIPEVYHKQVIGQGGLSIQTLMRKYNVYMRFANTTKEKYPNAFGDSRSDNVIIRCPAKNRSQIDAAAQELMEYVATLAKNHCLRYIHLSRNHRRMLLATQSNGLREAEVSSGAAIKLPTQETKEAQWVEISAQTQSNTEAAISQMVQLLSQTDYEFRIPWSTRFLQAVGPGSDFCTKVSVPLFLAMNAQVQAFEKVQMVGDSMVYSQIVVSVHENYEGELFDDISQVLTSYLRHYNLDIVDKGKLNTELDVESDASILTTLQDERNDTELMNRHQSSERSISSGAMLYRSPPQHEAQISLDFLKSQSQNIRIESLAPSSSASINQNNSDMSRIMVPKETPSGLPSRPPMSTVQWNRNFDGTPVKKRGLENEHDLGSDQSRPRLSTPRMRLARFHRRL